MNIVAIIDYKMCNLDSIARAVQECGGQPVVTDQAGDLETANRIILPGVGAFPDAMANIRRLGLDDIIREQVFGHQIPFLGICLGMHLMASRGFEFEETDGLDLVPGEVRRLEPFGEDTRIPHVGWNEVHFERQSPLFDGVDDGKDFYFVHSYHYVPDDEAHAAAYTPYGKGFVAVIQKDNIFGTQFHPEKSQRIGFQVLRNFLAA